MTALALVCFVVCAAAAPDDIRGDVRGDVRDDINVAAAPVADGGASARTGKQNGPPVDLNHASVEELCTLPGVGKKKADAIVALRTKRPFTRVTQLLQVKGIGRKTLERMRHRLLLAPPAKAEPAPQPPLQPPLLPPPLSLALPAG